MVRQVSAGEYDVVDVDENRHSIVCHDGCLARSGRRLTMGHRCEGMSLGGSMLSAASVHRFFEFDRVWGHKAENSRVYRQEVQCSTCTPQRSEESSWSSSLWWHT